jgi:hypothetical protein
MYTKKDYYKEEGLLLKMVSISNGYKDGIN